MSRSFGNTFMNPNARAVVQGQCQLLLFLSSFYVICYKDSKVL